MVYRPALSDIEFSYASALVQFRKLDDLNAKLKIRLETKRK